MVFSSFSFTRTAKSACVGLQIAVQSEMCRKLPHSDDKVVKLLPRYFFFIRTNIRDFLSFPIHGQIVD